ncbi:NAD(+)/NADH kinase [bacterium]|nr:MAG: NAD(+)/NADH kinase [bacterium]
MSNENLPVFNRIAVACPPQNPEAAAESKRVAEALRELGVSHVVALAISNEALRSELQGGGFDLLIVLGGDGSMMRAVHLSAPVGVPVLGVNFGHFGFLIEVQREGWRQRLPDLLSGRFWVEERMMLLSEHWRGERRLGSWQTLNEAVVARGQIVRPIMVNARVDGVELANYVADGVLVATATGSTAYALAVGGPIMPPELRNMLIVAIAPHLSIDRAVILPEGAQVSLVAQTTHQAVFSVDGHPPVYLENGDEVRVSANDHAARFIRFEDRGYFYRNITRYMQQNPSTGGTR